MEKIQIYPVQLAQVVVTVSPMPGRSGNFNTDIATLLAWLPDLALTMTTTAELHARNVPNRLTEAGINNRI